MDHNNIAALVKAFKQSLQVKNYVAKTTRQVIWKLQKFIDYLESKGIVCVNEITKEAVQAYQVEVCQTLNAKGYPNSIAYQNSMTCAMKQFVTFLWERDYIVANPAKDIHYAKTPKTLPRSILTPTEVKNLMRVIDTKTAIGYRDRTLFELLYSSGIRRTELRTLTLQDVDYDEGFIRVIGKGSKDRVVPIGRIACRYLENYIKSVRPTLVRAPYNIWVFLSYRGNQLDENIIAQLAKHYAKKAKIKKNIHCHTFRHSCATSMLRNKADIRVIQELLGHSSLNTTQVYTHVNITDLKRIHKQCHPREQDPE